MTAREREEYRALRATIRERGTARSWTCVVGLIVWAGLGLMIAIRLPSGPLTTLFSLLVLAATFEAIFALHVTVERIGRYIQVFYEEHDPDQNGKPGASVGTAASGGWERTAMALGRPLAGTGADPLFAALFGLATLLNLVAALSASPTAVEIGVSGAAHAILLVRIAIAGGLAARRRDADLERFRQIKSTPALPTRPMYQSGNKVD
ncbi:MAG: hypothetical protein WBD07_01980 [Vicinamibacterales bacterium]